MTVSATPGTPVMGIWRDTNPTAYINPPANPKLNSLFMLSATEGWAVGDSQPTVNITKTTSVGSRVSTALPAIFHYDGSTWNLVPAPRFPDFPFSPSAYNLTSVTFGPPTSPISRNDGWAVGFNITYLTSGVPNPEFPSTSGLGVLPPNATTLHWDGTAWRVQTAGLSGVNAGPLWSAFMVSSTDVWAVGQNRTGTSAGIGPATGIGGTFWHWTGVPGLGGGWNLVQPPVANVPFSVFMVSATEGWAVGSGGAIYHYTGGSWTLFASPVSTTLRSVYMVSPTEGWAVGDGGIILHYTSGTWSGPVSPGTTANNLFSVVMVSSTEGWTAGAAGTLLHYSGGAWTLIPPNLVPTSPIFSFSFSSLFANSATDIWSVGTAGVILHWDGSNWGSVTSPTFNNFTSISFGPPLTGPMNPNDGWAVGNASLSGEPTIYHWNGFMWTKGVTIGTTNNLNSVFMLNGGDVWAVGGGKNPTASCSTPPALCPVILHYTGGSWNTVTPPPGNYRLKGVFMVSITEGWAVGQSSANGPVILHYTVTGGVGAWATFPAPSTPTAIHSLNAVFMLSQTEGWAVGDNATILHYTVSGGVGTWNLVTVSGTPLLSPYANLTSVFMLSPTIGWAVGGIQANPAPLSNGGSSQIGGSYSAGPVIIYWDGTKWSPVPTPTIPGGLDPSPPGAVPNHLGHTSAILKSVYCTQSDDCWAAGQPGKLFATLLHWDGIAWNHVITSPALMGEEPPILSSVYMISPSSGWVVGSSPRFLTISSGGALSTILRFASFGGLTTMTATSTVVSTVTTATSLLTASTVSTATSLKTTTAVTTLTSSVTGGGIPGFPVESILAGLAFGLLTLSLLRRRRRSAAP
jgi:photosystem II stability/assembly factor-like uncharacterized protein